VSALWLSPKTNATMKTRRHEARRNLLRVFVPSWLGF
jgi:hypothetical protein